MASQITSQEYWKEVFDTVKEIVEETKGQDEDREWAFDRLFETVDGHEWIIYTWAYPWVLMYSDNEDELFESQGPQEATDYSQIMQAMAFWAFHQDVAERLEEALAEAGIE